MSYRINLVICLSLSPSMISRDLHESEKPSSRVLQVVQSSFVYHRQDQLIIIKINEHACITLLFRYYLDIIFNKRQNLTWSFCQTCSSNPKGVKATSLQFPPTHIFLSAKAISMNHLLTRITWELTMLSKSVSLTRLWAWMSCTAQYLRTLWAPVTSVCWSEWKYSKRELHIAGCPEQVGKGFCPSNVRWPHNRWWKWNARWDLFFFVGYWGGFNVQPYCWLVWRHGYIQVDTV